MKIVYISTFLPHQCGIATYTDYLINGIRAINKEINIKVVCEINGHPLKQVNFEVVPCWRRDENYIQPIVENTKDADIIHIQHEYSIYRFDYRLPTLLQTLKPKKVITIHCVRPSQFSERGPTDENYAQKIAELSDCVILHLESQKEILVRLGIEEEKIRIIPHGTELADIEKEQARKKLNLPEYAQIILMFGFLKRHKCIHIALEAFRDILNEIKNVYFFIAGGLSPTASDKEKEYLKIIEEKIKEFGIEKNVIFPNKFFPNEDVPYILCAADIILFPYYEEDRSASGSFHLSIGAKKPVIASRIPKFEELKNISDELLILPYNSSGIAKVAIRIFKEKEFENYILSKTDEYRKLTSWQTIAAKHLEVYKEMLQL